MKGAPKRMKKVLQGDEVGRVPYPWLQLFVTTLENLLADLHAFPCLPSDVGFTECWALRGLHPNQRWSLQQMTEYKVIIKAYVPDVY